MKLDAIGEKSLPVAGYNTLQGPTDQTRLREFGAADDTVELAVAQQLLIIKTIYTNSRGRPDWLSTTARACSVSFRELPSFGPS